MQEVGGSNPLTSRICVYFHYDEALNNTVFFLKYYKKSMFSKYNDHLIIYGYNTSLLEEKNPALLKVKDHYKQANKI